MYPQTNVNVSANKTLTDADLGITQVVTGSNTDGVVITLPAAAAGKAVRVINQGKQAGGTVGSGTGKSAGIIVRPAGTDTMTGNGFTPAAAKGAVNTKATQKAGDLIDLVSGAATWYIRETVGVWAREA